MSSDSQIGKVLIVDDDPACLSTLDVALHGAPELVVISAASAENALRILDVELICAVITDLQLPGMTGLELIARLRRQARFQALPVVVVSASADPAAPALAASAGASAYFAKPFSPVAVRNRVRELVQEYLNGRKGGAGDA